MGNLQEVLARKTDLGEEIGECLKLVLRALALGTS